MKRFITMTLAVLLAVTAFAQNLEGTWSYTGNKNEKMNGENNVNGELQVNRRLGVPGRNITLNLEGSYSESNNESYSRSVVKYYQRTDGSLNADYQNIFSPSKNYSGQGRISYTEPILKGTVVQASYQAQYRFQDTDREMMVYK